MYNKVLACVLVVVVVLSLGCLQQETQRSGMPESTPDSSMPHQDEPFRGTFVGSEIVSLNQPAEITFTICPIEDAPNTTISLFLPPDVELVDGNTEWSGDVKSNEEVQVSVVIRVPIEMRGNIKASVERPVNEIKIRRSYYCLISTMKREDNVSESRRIVVEMPKQDDPFKGSFVGSEIPYLNQVAQITFSVTPEEDMPSSSIKFFLPPDAELKGGGLEWQGDLKEGQPLSLDLSIKVTDKVEQNIKAEALTYIDGFRITRSYYFPFSTVDEPDPSPTKEPDGTLMMQTRAKNISLGSPPSRANIQKQPKSPGYITVIGKFDYVNENGGYSPMRHVYTELWESEIGLDESLGYDYTDDDGNFYYYVDNDDGYLQDGRDVYVRAWAYSNAAKTTTDLLGAQYNAFTTTKNDVPDGTVVDFGSVYPTSYNEAWEAVDAAWSEYIWINKRVGWTRSRVHIKWPSGTWPETDGDRIYLPDKGTPPPPGWDHDTVHHEYGHCVMWNAYGNSWPSHGSYPSHWASMESDEGFATLEGWAEFMQCVVDNDPNNLQDLYGWGNIEFNDWHNEDDSGDFDGDIIEGSFASILWDIFDPANDDGLNMGFDAIWTIMLNDRPGSIHDIWDGWSTRGYGHDQALWQIYYNYGVNKDNVIPTVDVFSVTPSSVTLGDSFMISYTVSDTGGSGLKQVELWRKSTGDWGQIEVTSLVGVGDGPYSNSFSDAPLSVGTYEYGIHIVDNAGNLGFEPDPPGPIEVTVTATPSIDLSPSSYGFGDRQVGQCSSEYSFTLTNTGGGTATGSVSLTGTHASQFTITQGSGSFSLGTGASKTIKMKFCPTSTGAKSATIFADGTNCNDDSSSLSGTGTQTPSIDISPSSYGFGDMQVGQCSPDYSFTLTNTGGGTATGSVSLTGTHATQFTITQGSGSFSLGTGASKTIKVKFCPTSTGAKSATLFADGTNCNDDSSSLSGTGTQTPSIDISPSSYGFGNRQVGQCSPDYSFTLTNTGGSTATGSVSLTGTHASQFTITQGSGSFSLGTGASKTIKMKFCPTSTGAKSATLFADGTNCNDDSSSLSGTGTQAPSIDISPSSYGFGNMQVGQCSPDYSFTLTNTGGSTATGSVSLTGTHATQFTITQGSGSFSLGTGASKTIKVKFCPTSTGAKSATIFADGTNCNDDSSSLSGTGTQTPSIDISPSSYGFGNMQVGQCSPDYSFTLTNTGGSTATGSVSLTGTHATQFTITQGSGSFSLGTGASKTIKVKFCPTSTGAKSATLFADGTNCNDDSSSLSGTGTQTPSIDISPSSYGFGNMQVGQCSPDYSFTLTNTGGSTATGSVSLTGTHATQFTITQGSGSFSLGTGASKTIKVKFCPTSTGAKSATLFADGTNCNDDSSSLSGTGTQTPSIDISPSSYGFGDMQVGQCSSDYSFTLTNTGGSTATGSVSLTGTHATQFTITQGSGSFSLGTGASKTIKVKFCPTSTGAKSATLFADGTNCNDDSSSLSGTGTQTPSIDISPSSYGFGDMQVGQCSSDYSFTLTNTGGSTATGSVSLTGTHATQFTITQGSGSFSLGTGASKTIKVKFCPTSTGAKSATLFADGTNCNDDSSSLSGTGVENLELSYSPTSHDFGDMCEGETGSTTFELWNSGTGTLTYTLSETCDWVEVNPTSGSSTGEHDTIMVDIDTTGLSEGTHTCDISINSNDGTGTFTVTVNVVPCPESSWTYMVYLDGDNNLEGAGIDDFLEMSSVGSTSDVNIVVQFDRIPGYSSAYDDWTTCKRFLVTQGMTPTPVNALMDLGECNMGDPDTLRAFVEWAMAEYPADNYALILWNHGSGYKKWVPWADETGIDRGICYDDTDGDHLTLQETEQALAGKHVEVLGYDACLMHMIEVVYQVRTHAAISVGSEEYEPGDGWPYNTILGDLTGTPTMTPSTLGDKIVSRYIASYAPAGDETQSAVDKAKVSNLASAVDTLAQVLIDKLSDDYAKIQQARNGVEEFVDPDFIDLYHFAELIKLYLSDNPAAVAAAQAVMDNVDNTVTAEGHGTAHPNAHGLSIYFPEAEWAYLSSYENTKFAVDTHWDEFLKQYYAPSKPDLIITDTWLCWPDNCTICYNVTNTGDGTAPACHNTTLYVDDVAVAHDHVPVELAPGESYIGCFDGYTWTYTPPSDNITVCADNSETLDELDEDNNCLTNIWMCGDVNGDRAVNVIDVVLIYKRALDPGYPLDLPWAGDVNCDCNINVIDVVMVYKRALDPGYDLDCCCEVV